MYTQVRKEEDVKAWREQRRAGIGGSDIATVVGLNPWNSRLRLYMDKKGLLPEQEDNNAMWWGRELEDIIARRFEKEEGKKTHRSNFIYFDAERPYKLANIDRKVEHENAILECKSTNAMGKSAWQEGIPDYYACQVQWYMSILEMDYAYVSVVTGNKDFFTIKVDRDDSVIKLLNEKADEFWNEYVLKGVPPTAGADDGDVLDILYPERRAECVVIPSEFYERITEYNKLTERKKELDAQVKVLKADIDAIKNEAIQQLAGAESGMCGSYIIQNKLRTTRRLDTDKIRSVYPDVATDCTKETTSNIVEIKETNNG